ncbi:MAG TPA: protein-disulfide reductase DsbD domain-containing protein [Flavitalea sp.]|nr:protein-disulfide reductase DsbD domain-containing protein [Flavitalea sp.]
MKRIILSITISFLCLISLGQSTKQVKWTFTSKKIADKTYEVHMTANINGQWHLYAQDAGEGPLSTTFNFTKNPLLQVDGKVKEIGKMKKVFEQTFNSEVRFYEKSVNFIQVVKVRGNAKTNLSGKVEFMVCDDKLCLPPGEVEFSVNVGD